MGQDFNRGFRLQNPNQSTKLECGALYGAKLLLDVKKTSTFVQNVHRCEQNLKGRDYFFPPSLFGREHCEHEHFGAKFGKMFTV